MSTTTARTLQLLHKQPEGGNVWSFIFAPSQPLSWTAGQFIRIELPHANPDEEGTKRQFTIASAPAETVIQISTRLTASSFKQALAALPLGGRLNLLDPPAGNFIWQPSDRPLVFVAQGIGVTPFISLLRQRHLQGGPLPATLVFANRLLPAPFHAELQQLAAAHPEFTLHHSQTPTTAASLSRLIPELAQSLIYISGPKSLIELLGPPHNLPAGHLRQDQFPNYPSAAY